MANLKSTVSIAELVAAYRAALEEVRDYLDDRADVNDGVDGRPVANDAMRLLQTVNAALAMGEK